MHLAMHIRLVDYIACRAALHTFGCLSNTVNVIIFPNNVTECGSLTVFSVTDWSDNDDTSGSTTGYIVYMWGVQSRYVKTRQT